MKLKAFTIIELMVVCIIIGVLSAVVLVSLEKSKIRTRDAQRKADLTRIAGALESYRADKKVYPITFTTTLAFSDVPGTNTDLAKLISENYINSLPTDPKTSTDYYQYASDGGQYKLLAKSETILSSELAAPAQSKAGDFYNSITGQFSCFQISSSNSALTTYTNSDYCN